MHEFSKNYMNVNYLQVNWDNNNLHRVCGLMKYSSKLPFCTQTTHRGTYVGASCQIRPVKCPGLRNL